MDIYKETSVIEILHIGIVICSHGKEANYKSQSKGYSYNEESLAPTQKS